MFFVNNEPLHRAINTTGIAAWSNAENHRALAESPAGGDKSPSSKQMVAEKPRATTTISNKQRFMS